MNTTIDMTKKVTTLVSILTVEPENQQKLIRLLRDNTESVVSSLDGWISTSFIAATESLPKNPPTSHCQRCLMECAPD